MRQGDITIIEYEMGFQDLVIFAFAYLSIERHHIERLRDGFRQVLKRALIVMLFHSVQDLVYAAVAMER